MAKLKFDRKEFEKHIKITKEIEEKITLFGTPLESLTKDEVEIEIFPNRPDLLSMQGFLRAFKAFLGKETGLKAYRINKPEKDYKIKVDPNLKNIRPYTACAIVKGLKFDGAKIKEIIDLQEKLHTTIGRNRKKSAIGIYPLEKITLPIRFEARAPEDIKFIPLEETRELTGLEILQKTSTGREYAHLLEGFDKFPVFVDANNKILSMPPIINSDDTGKITEQTKDVFIECSGFDFNTEKKVLNIVATTLADMGGKVYAMELQGLNATTPDLTPETLKVSLENVNKLLGLELKEKDLEKILPKMGYNYSKSKVQVPAWRTDVLHEVDIIEDIAIAYGYDKFAPEIPKVATIGSEDVKEKLKTKLANLLVGLGLLETSSYHLIKSSESQDKELIEVLDSKTEYKFLRPNLLIPALRTISENKDHDYPQKIFEICTRFQKDSRIETGVKETENLCILCSPSNFTDLKQILNYLAGSLSLSLTLKESTHKYLIDGRTATILLNNKEIGYLGEIHPETLHSWSIKMPCSVLEISLEEIFNKIN